MAVKLFFGLPGCGKTTILTMLAIKGVKNRRYQNVYCNVGIAVPGVTFIDNSCIGKYDLRNGLILIDEGTVFADSRDYKNFSKSLVEFFMMHRHYNLDIVIFTQGWDALDKKIRVITDRVYYVFKTPLSAPWISKYYRIPYGIIIPDPKKNPGGEKLGDIVQGYCKPNFWVRLFAHRVYRPRYYKYFDSWECKELPPLPDEYVPYVKPPKSKKLFSKAHRVVHENVNMPPLDIPQGEDSNSPGSN